MGINDLHSVVVVLQGFQVMCERSVKYDQANIDLSIKNRLSEINLCK